MKVVIQRVSSASVAVDGQVKGAVGAGLCILLGIEEDDNEEDISWLTKKIVQLTIFDDDDGVMNRSLLDTGGEILLVSQFTLHASTKKGNRPSYIRAAHPETAIPLYNRFVHTLDELTGKEPATGEFGAMMQISLVNEGPVTIIIDSKNRV